MRNLMAGMAILMPMYPEDEDDDYSYDCDRNMLWVPGNIPSAYTDDDLQKLREYGFIWDDGFGWGVWVN